MRIRSEPTLKRNMNSADVFLDRNSSAAPTACDSRDPGEGKNQNMATVLLVDDSAVIRQGLGLALVQSGFEVLFAADGEQALELARRASPDLILLDLFLPKLNGWEVIKALKKVPLTAKIPVIVVTSLAQSEAKLGRADISGFFEKAKLDLIRGSEELIRVVGNTLRTAVRHHAATTADAAAWTPRAVAAPIASGKKVLVADDCPLQLRVMSSGPF